MFSTVALMASNGSRIAETSYDYAGAVAGDPPKKIVGIWLIANNLFAKQRVCKLSQYQLSDDEQVFSY